MNNGNLDELIYLYRQGNDEAYDQLYREIERMTSQMIYRLFHSLGASGWEKEECMQIGLICFQQSLNNYCETKAKTFAGYFYAVLNYALKNYRYRFVRTQTREIPLESLQDYEQENILAKHAPYRGDPIKMMSYEKTLELLETLAGQTSGLEKRVITCLLHGENSKEMAGHLGIAPRQINNALYRIRKKLRIIGQ